MKVHYDPQSEGQPVWLVGWATAQVPTGATSTVEVTTDARMWRRWDTQIGSWGEPLTGGRLLVARGLGDIRADLPLRDQSRHRGPKQSRSIPRKPADEDT